MKWTDRFTGFLDDAEQAALSLVARLGPWLSPIAPAYFIARAASLHLSAPLPVAVAMGVAVEAVGIAAFIATMRAYTWNRERNARDTQAPAWLGVILIVVYLAVGIGLAVVVEVWPPLIPWAPAAFFILAGVAYLVLGMLSDQARRERESETSRQASRGVSAFRKLAEQEYGLSRAQSDALLVRAGNPLTAMSMLSDIDRATVGQQELSRTSAHRWPDKATFLSDPDRPTHLTVEQIMTQSPVTERTARRWLKAVRNGNG